MGLVRSPGKPAITVEIVERLTQREAHVAALMVDDLTRDEIAAVLSMSTKTVDAHVRRIRRKGFGDGSDGLGGVREPRSPEPPRPQGASALDLPEATEEPPAGRRQ